MTTTTNSIRTTQTTIARVQGLVTGRSSFIGVVPVRSVSPRTVTPRLLAQRDEAMPHRGIFARREDPFGCGPEARGAWSPPRDGGSRASGALGRKT